MYFPVKPGIVVTRFSNLYHRGVGGFSYRLDRGRGCRRALSERAPKEIVVRWLLETIAR